MIAVLQRVKAASVRIKDKIHSQIGKGILILLGVEKEDTETKIAEMAKKIAGLRIFDDEQGKMNLSNETIGGEYLIVSQFTLCADLSKGKRPGFEFAKPPAEAEGFYKLFCQQLADITKLPVKSGVFGETMLIELTNDGPATFIIKM